MRTPDHGVGDTYARTAIDTVPRILGMMDRSSDATTYGCSDRNYWHYGIVDFPNARYQEASLLVAQATACNTPGNALFDHALAVEWARAAVTYWASIQKRDGSFDEVYPNERSYVATAFTTWAVGRTCELLDLHQADEALERAAIWLSIHENADVSNQVAGAAAAIHLVGQRLENDDLMFAAAEKRDRLLSAQTPEGWFPEYGGWDIGYLSICLGYLTWLACQTADDDLIAASHRAADFVEQKVRQDGTCDINGSSRCTQYLYPSGFARLGRLDILTRHERGVALGRVMNPTWMDDRFFAPLASDYLTTHLELTRDQQHVAPDHAQAV
tara:strand:- start:10549 stop:11532 length:984 start_codon:yes stop_codon:yes gene_type:complete